MQDEKRSEREASSLPFLQGLMSNDSPRAVNGFTKSNDRYCLVVGHEKLLMPFVSSLLPLLSLIIILFRFILIVLLSLDISYHPLQWSAQSICLFPREFPSSLHHEPPSVSFQRKERKTHNSRQTLFRSRIHLSCVCLSLSLLYFLLYSNGKRIGLKEERIQLNFKWRAKKLDKRNGDRDHLKRWRERQFISLVFDCTPFHVACSAFARRPSSAQNVTNEISHSIIFMIVMPVLASWVVFIPQSPFSLSLSFPIRQMRPSVIFQSTQRMSPRTIMTNFLGGSRHHSNSAHSHQLHRILISIRELTIITFILWIASSQVKFNHHHHLESHQVSEACLPKW